VNSDDPAARVRTLLLRGDNLLKKAQTERALQAFEEARAAAAADGVDPRVRDLVDRRIESVRSMA
jgi:predicted negative regulator of RcsB-dependent stress response